MAQQTQQTAQQPAPEYTHVPNGEQRQAVEQEAWYIPSLGTLVRIAGGALAGLLVGRYLLPAGSKAEVTAEPEMSILPVMEPAKVVDIKAARK